MSLKKITIQFILLFLYFSLPVKAQERLPIDGSTLNYIQIMFEVPFEEKATSYKFRIEECDIRAEKCKKIAEFKSKNRAIYVSEPFEFGKIYKWTYEALKGKTVIKTGVPYIFYTGKSSLLDTSLQKMVYTKPNRKKQNGILMIDGLKLAVDMHGKPVMYINYTFDHAVRDINLTPQGTLTLVDNRLGEIKEMKLNGEMTWIGPTKHQDGPGRKDKFHHEFEKLNNGHFIAAGKKQVSDFDETSGLTGVPGNTLCETIVEFDQDVNEVWRFNLLPELKRQYNIAPTVNMFNPTRLGHLNGIAIDTTNQIAYASFKTFNMVMKIDKQSNNILYLYGLKKVNFLDSLEKGLRFEQQHAPVFNKKGNILIFNNGNPETGSGFTELKTGNNLNEKNEVVKSIYFKKFLKKDVYAPQMGSVQQIGKYTYLICMGSLPHLFMVNTFWNTLLWQAYTFQNTQWEEKGIQWKALYSYRIHYYSSLYPYYFVADKVIHSEGGELIISNAGSEPDTYLVQSLNDSLAKVATIKIKPGKSKKIHLKNYPDNSRFEIRSLKSNQAIAL